jgi:putative glutamine amidotransferase
VDEGNVVCSVPYVRAIRESGGLPVIVPPLEDHTLRSEYLERLDGLVLTGGWDIPPSAYGEAAHPTTETMPMLRWEWEHRLIETWLDSRKPLLGICLGAQMTNVVRGGTMIQDIPSEVGNAVTHRSVEPVHHRITVKPATRLHDVLGQTELIVQSSHHQAVERPGEGLHVTARSDDGVAEALESADERWLLLLQWHPERMDEVHRKKVFGAFIEACR